MGDRKEEGHKQINFLSIHPSKINNMMMMMMIKIKHATVSQS